MWALASVAGRAHSRLEWGRPAVGRGVTRFETGAGYRFDRDVMSKLVFQHTRIAATGPRTAVLQLFLVADQLSIRF